MEPFPFEIPIEVRFRDLDPMGHVNNAVYATYLENVRAAFAREVLGVSEAADFDFILARLEIDYRRPVVFGEAVVAGLAVSSVGRSSFTFDYRLSVGGEVAATGRSVQVFYDYAARAKKPVPERFSRAVGPYLLPGARPC